MGNFFSDQLYRHRSYIRDLALCINEMRAQKACDSDLIHVAVAIQIKKRGRAILKHLGVPK